MRTRQTYAAAAALAAVFFAAQARAQTTADAPPAFDQTVSAAFAPDGLLSAIPAQKAEAVEAGANGRTQGFRPGPSGPVGPRPLPRPDPNNGPNRNPNHDPNNGPGNGPGRNPNNGPHEAPHGGDWGRWPNHPGWGSRFGPGADHRWDWRDGAPHWWGWALWAGVADRAACFNWYGGELNSCGSSCQMENDTCVDACYGDGDCVSQCNVGQNDCANTCQADYSLNVGTCPF